MKTSNLLRRWRKSVTRVNLADWQGRWEWILFNSTERRWRVWQMNAEFGETVLGGRCIGGHVERAFQLPAAEMRAAINIQGVTRDSRGVCQVQDCIGDVLDRRWPAHR